MTDTTMHLKIVEVESDDEPDVTLEGSEIDIAELSEIVDLKCLLQNKLIRAEQEVDSIDVDITPRRGLRGMEAKLSERGIGTDLE